MEVAKEELHSLEGEVQKGSGGDKERLEEERSKGCLGAWSGYGQGSGERYRVRKRVFSDVNIGQIGEHLNIVGLSIHSSRNFMISSMHCRSDPGTPSKK